MGVKNSTANGFWQSCEGDGFNFKLIRRKIIKKVEDLKKIDVWFNF